MPHILTAASRRLTLLACLIVSSTDPLWATDPSDTIARIIAAYPDQRLSRDGDVLVWPAEDGTRMRADDGKGEKAFEAWLADPDLEDMLKQPYPAFAPATAPPREVDPGRARNEAFFSKMYGDCRTGAVKKHLRPITWLPKKAGQRLEVTTVNGVDRALERVSRTLDELGPDFDKYLFPAAGTYNCRVIAGTDRASAHGFGIAIDIATKHTSYWRWSKPGPDGAYPYKNDIPPEIVSAFEREGFIWGGRWYHYDTMHFEYRPELIRKE